MLGQIPGQGEGAMEDYFPWIVPSCFKLEHFVTLLTGTAVCASYTVSLRCMDGPGYNRVHGICTTVLTYICSSSLLPKAIGCMSQVYTLYKCSLCVCTHKLLIKECHIEACFILHSLFVHILLCVLWLATAMYEYTLEC